MRRLIRASVAAVAVAFALGAAGCSNSSTDSDEQGPVDNALSKIDPCAIMNPEKAAQAGLPAQGEPNDDIDSQPGCRYSGDSADISIHRVANDTLEELGKRSVWSEFKRVNVNGRDGAEAHLPEDTENDCTTAVSAGGGVVIVNASAADPRKSFDACGESLKVAKLIEPDLPK